MVDIEGYRECVVCRGPVLDHVAYMTGGVCFDPCFIDGKMARFREIEVIHRATILTARRPPANTKAKNNARAKLDTERRADLARLRACRRMRYLFPDVFDLLYAEERHRAGLIPRPTRAKDRLARAVATYTAFATYDAPADRSDNGATQV